MADTQVATTSNTKKPAEKKGEKKPNIFKRMWRKIKEVFSELRKVTWPSIPKTIRQTGVVIAVVLVFLVIIGLVDWGFSALFSLIK